MDDLNEPLLPPASSSKDNASIIKTSSTSHKTPAVNNNTYLTSSQLSWKRRARRFPSKLLWLIFEIYTNQSGSFCNILSGVSITFLLGSVVGLYMPKNTDFPSVSYRTISSILGYTYFFCWSISFYPQLFINYTRKSVLGLSTDASIMQLVNFTSYAIYCTFFYFDTTIRHEYQTRHPGSDIMITSNDVAFSVHALVLTCIMIGQILYYGGYTQQPLSYVTLYITWTILALCTIYILFIVFHVSFFYSSSSASSYPHQPFLWIDFLFFLAFIKLLLTLCTYIPQLFFNYQRKSTRGFNIWNVLLDFTGGILSLLQLVLDGYHIGTDQHHHHLEDIIKGNWAKCFLSLISIFFDTIFFLQHFILYYKPVGGVMSNDDEEDEDQIVIQTTV